MKYTIEVQLAWFDQFDCEEYTYTEVKKVDCSTFLAAMEEAQSFVQELEEVSGTSVFELRIN